MKKLIPLILIICLLLPSCQPSKTQFIAESTSANGSEEFTTASEYSSFEESTAYDSTEAVTAAVLPSFTANSITNTVSRVSSTAGVSKTAALSVSAPASTRAATAAPKPASPKTTAGTTKPAETQTELRGIWISCYDYISAAGKTRSEYKAETDKMFKSIADCGFNTAFVHMRAFSDAFYESDIYPYSSFVAGTEGAPLPFDPFKVILESAKKYGISVHGWINPFRVSTKNDPSLLSASNPAKKILDGGNSEGEVCILKNGIYYNPACVSNHKLILDGVREILGKYDIDGIHIDDYFYPSTDKSIDNKQYSQYKASSGALSLAEWRRASVNSFVSSLYSTVKATNSNLTVSISPAAQIEKNKNELYADCALWLSSKGYADIIIPQIYFGFEHETLDFQSLLAEWAALPRNPQIKLVCGLAAYKCGKNDAYAGTGSAEWQENTDILARQLKCIRKNKNYSGFVVFSYKDLNRAACKTEIQNLKEAV
ncbi:MAG: family 10 glycosylhydrolase [Clostridiaceae bacterium]|nr:family 10 glycosylhydrolase [Clostridiaceae bacterium]